MNEYRNIYRNDPARMAQFNETYSLRDGKVLSPTEEMAQMNQNQADFDAKVSANSSRALTVTQEPLTFGRGLKLFLKFELCVFIY